ncbi:peptide deformylase [Luedemannella helvata]|uniref:Peptide deformylase n=1 Tax=Luedemannella helvata TaxID=349315 RepID=A0ABN2KWG7_9ACTN
MIDTSVRLFGDPVLRQPCSPVVDFDRELAKLAKSMHATLAREEGAGLAAPQVGVLQRMFVFHVDRLRGELVNPVLEFPDEEEQDGPEGCLSMPGLYFDTIRRQNVVARGFSLKGDPVQIVGSGFLARCLQHETDHLDGVLFLDRMDRERKREAMLAIRRAEWFSDEPLRVKESPHPMFGRNR